MYYQKLGTLVSLLLSLGCENNCTYELVATMAHRLCSTIAIFLSLILITHSYLTAYSSDSGQKHQKHAANFETGC